MNHGASNIERWRSQLTQEQKAAWRQKISVGLKKSFAARAAAKAGGVPNGEITHTGVRSLAIGMHERLNGKYVKGTSRTLLLTGAPWEVDELLKKLEIFANRLKGQLQQSVQLRSRVTSTKVIDFTK